MVARQYVQSLHSFFHLRNIVFIVLLLCASSVPVSIDLHGEASTLSLSEMRRSGKSGGVVKQTSQTPKLVRKMKILDKDDHISGLPKISQTPAFLTAKDSLKGYQDARASVDTRHIDIPLSWHDLGDCKAADWMGGSPIRHYSYSGSRDACKAQCLTDHGSSCHGIEYHASHECRTFGFDFRGYDYSNCAWSVVYTSYNIIRWTDLGPYHATRWLGKSPVRHYQEMSLEECKTQCLSEHGHSCYAVEYASYECRTFGYEPEPMPWRGQHWQVSLHKPTVATSPPVKCPSPAGQHSDCTHVGGEHADHDVASCADLMESLDGDTFNLRDGQCFVKRCLSANMQYSGTHGEYDVYSLRCRGEIPMRCANVPEEHSACYEVGGAHGTGHSIMSCTTAMNSAGGDTFNLGPDGQCQVAKCDSSELHYSTSGPWGDNKVFSKFCRAEPLKCPSPKGMSSSCEDLGGGQGDYTLESCIESMYRLGGDTINFKSTECLPKRCGSEDMRYTSNPADHEVYSIYCQTAEAHTVGDTTTMYIEGSPNGIQEELMTAFISATPGTYVAQVSFLRTNPGEQSQYLQRITLQDHMLGDCQPGGAVWEDPCTFSACREIPAIEVSTGQIALSIEALIGAEQICECDKSSWNCSRTGAVLGRLPMRAVAQVKLTKK